MYFVCQTYTGKNDLWTPLNIFASSQYYREIYVRNSLCAPRVLAASDKQRILEILCGQVKNGKVWMWMLKPPVLSWMDSMCDADCGWQLFTTEALRPLIFSQDAAVSDPRQRWRGGVSEESQVASCQADSPVDTGETAKTRQRSSCRRLAFDS